MSRRREAAELARVLLLSTQEASTAAYLSPHTLSSSKSGTQESRDMELRAVEPLMGVSVADPTVDSIVPLPSGEHWGLPPAVRTIAQDQAQGTVSSSTLSGDQLSDPIVTTTPSHDTMSHIASFTPSYRLPLEATPRVPASSAQRDSPAALHPVPGSGTSRAPFASSPNMPIPSSRISSDKSHVSSSSSSHRPLFSPTQTSSRPALPSTDSPRPRQIITYGKNPLASDHARANALGGGEERQRSPLKAADPPLIHATTSRPRLPLSDDENEIDEPVEARERPALHHPSSRPAFEVVLPSREASKARDKGLREHPDSPDPLDTNIHRPIVRSAERSPLDPLPPLPTQLPVLVSPTKSTHSHGTGTQRSDRSAGPTRVSHRQQVQKEKEEAEKEAKREARRIRKEKERLEKERQELEAKRGQDRGSRRGRVEEESIVPLETQVSNRKPKLKSVTKSPAKPPSEVIVIEDETMPVEQAAPRQSRSRAVPADATDGHDETRADGYKVKKRRREDEEDDEEDQWNGSDVEHTAKSAKKKTTDAKRKNAKSKAKAPARATESTGSDDYSNENNRVDLRRSSPTEIVARGLEDKVAEEDDEGEDPVQHPPKEKELPQKEPNQDRTTPVSPVKPTSVGTTASSDPGRTPLRPTPGGVNTPQNTATHRPSPGPSTGPKGYQWKTERNDLASVLSKFGGARQSGMSRRSKIAPLHMKIGPPAKALPPPPPKPSRKKKGDSDDEEDDSDAEMESDGEGGLRKKKKEKGIEWFMVED